MCGHRRKKPKRNPAILRVSARTMRTTRTTRTTRYDEQEAQTWERRTVWDGPADNPRYASVARHEPHCAAAVDRASPQAASRRHGQADRLGHGNGRLMREEGLPMTREVYIALNWF